ncbi:hypothetical protein ACP4OV_002242 [Aristida adscensionis]
MATQNGFFVACKVILVATIVALLFSTGFAEELVSAPDPSGYTQIKDASLDSLVYCLKQGYTDPKECHAWCMKSGFARSKIMDNHCCCIDRCCIDRVQLTS